MKYPIALFFCLLCATVFSQQLGYVDFKNSQIRIGVYPNEKDVRGIVTYTFDIIKPTDSIYLDAINMQFSEVSLNGNSVQFRNTDAKLWIQSAFEPSRNNSISFTYLATPRKALYFVKNQIWTQGQGKYTSNWVPSIDDVNDKIEFDLSITYHKDYLVVANGELVNTEENDSSKTWHFNMDKPMSSYLLALAIGQYDKKTKTSKSGIPLEYYYYPEDSAKVEPTYRYSKQMFNFLEAEIGLPYPWEIYKQVPVSDFLYSGMENTSMTIFSDAFVVDSIGFNDLNYVNVNAHELAHQWFGDLVTAKSGKHHWLQEGFATYYALLAERDIFGEAYYYWRLYEYAQQLIEQEKAGKSTALIDPTSSSLTFYKKGCWALHVLKEQIGEVSFRMAVKNYLLKHQYANVETSDFIEEIERASEQNLDTFVKTWLKSDSLPQNDMTKSLEKSEFIQNYINLDCSSNPSKCQDYLDSDKSDQVKIKIISQENYQITSDDFNNSLKVRQAIAEKLSTIPVSLKANYESLLKDKSYLTIETALYNLWINFPQERVNYLESTKDIYGLSNLNVRQLWLVLHLNTKDYQPDKKQDIYQELLNYSSDNYGFEVRQKAFTYLKLIDTFDATSLQNLIQATRHHNWRFRQFAKTLMDVLIQNENYKAMIEKLMIAD